MSSSGNSPFNIPKTRLEFGCQPYTDAISQRITRHFENTHQEDPLVVGIFGEWGCGKSTWLNEIGYTFQQAAHVSKIVKEKTLTVPVFFNAWRYENEEHLIVPLIKTTEKSLKLWLQSNSDTSSVLEDKERFINPPPKKLLNWAKSKAEKLALGAIAVGSGIKGNFQIPMLGSIEIDPGKMREAEEQLNKKYLNEKSRNESFFEKMDSIYYNFHEYMKEITGRSGESDFKINFLFLIDDLDRCLPEKAVQMLESIKLFLDVKGCAFVLALDDEVVERGISHRYRDYKINGETHFDSVAHSLNPDHFEKYKQRQHDGPAEPISGHEYLEKMVHLPVRVPLPTDQSVREYLLKHFPDIFTRTVFTQENEDSERPDKENERTKEHEKGQDQLGKTTGIGRNQRRSKQLENDALLQLFKKAIPNVPRKLNRAAELLRLRVQVARKNNWEDIDTLTLARLTLLQLFSPEVYRFAQRFFTTFLTEMESWCEMENWDVGTSLENELNHIHSEGTQGDKYAVERILRPFLKRIREAQYNRSGFDPFDLIDLDNKSDENLFDYFTLSRFSDVTHRVGTERSSERSRSSLKENKTVTQNQHIVENIAFEIEDEQRFINLLFSSNRTLWKDAIVHEKLDSKKGDHLSSHVFERMLQEIEILRQVNEGKDEKSSSKSIGIELITVDWLANLAPYVSSSQLKQLYKATGILDRLQSANSPIKK